MSRRAKSDMPQQIVRHGKATVSWGKRFYGPDTIVANCPADSFADLIEAVRLAAEQASEVAS